MAKTRFNRLAMLASSGEPPETFGLGDLFMYASGLKVPDGFPAGTIAPVSVPEGNGRDCVRKKLAAEFVTWDHDKLARAAALLFEGSSLWRGVFAQYAKEKAFELAQAKFDASKRLSDKIGEFLDLVDDPSLRAYLNAQARIARDPKQAVKPEAEKRWRDWQSGNVKYKSGAAFARHFVDEFPIIENQKTVERWVTKWRKTAAAKRRK